mgnify:CR=1 FL=1
MVSRINPINRTVFNLKSAVRNTVYERKRMNNKIKELERKYWDRQANILDSEKFAEAIVKECCNALWTDSCNFDSEAYAEYVRNIKKIKDKLGVE